MKRNVFIRLQSMIVRGRFAPGMLLLEKDVAERLRVSRTPVREALQRLRHEGLVIATGGGARPRLCVAPLSRSAVFDLYQIVGVLDGLAGRNAATLPLARRRSVAARMAESDSAFKLAASASRPDWDTLFELHDAFHREMRVAGAGPHLLALLHEVRPQIDRYEWYFAPLTGPDFSPTYSEHAAIVRAIRSGSMEMAEAAVRSNWFNGGARLAAAIDDHDTC